MRLIENDGEHSWPVKSLRDAKKMIGGLDLSMATVDADLQDYKVYDDDNKLVFQRPRIRVP